jgi:hypothetical protein
MIRELRSGEYRHDSMLVRRRPSIDRRENSEQQSYQVGRKENDLDIL